MKARVSSPRLTSPARQGQEISAAKLIRFSSVLGHEALAALPLQLGAERRGVVLRHRPDADAEDGVAVDLGLADHRRLALRGRDISAGTGRRPSGRRLPSWPDPSCTAKPPVERRWRRLRRAARRLHARPPAAVRARWQASAAAGAGLRRSKPGWTPPRRACSPQRGAVPTATGAGWAALRLRRQGHRGPRRPWRPAGRPAARRRRRCRPAGCDGADLARLAEVQARGLLRLAETPGTVPPVASATALPFMRTACWTSTGCSSRLTTLVSPLWLARS